MRRCTYCGAEYEDAVAVCIIDRQPVVEVLPPPGRNLRRAYAPVEFLRLMFKSPKEEEFAVRCAEFLAIIVGKRVKLLRPDTKWSEIIGWVGEGRGQAIFLVMALRRELGVDLHEILANPELTTFRDFVEHVCSRENKKRLKRHPPKNVA